MGQSIKSNGEFKVQTSFIYLMVSFLSLLISCSLVNLDGLDTFEKKITGFIFKAKDNSGKLTSDLVGKIDSDTDTINITVPFGTSLYLIPTITFRGKSLTPKSGQSRTFVEGVGVPYTVYAEDDSIKKYIVTITVGPGDGIPPGQVTVTGVTEDNGQVTVEWTDPGDADFDHVEITWTPAGTGTNSVAGGTETFTASGLTNGTAYTFSIVSVDDANNKSAAVIVKVTPDAAGPFINYCIYTADDLNAVRGGIKTGWDKTKSYIMMADIDLSAYSPWTPLGTSSSDFFSGNFNGNAHDITNLYINTTADYQGLFGYISGSSIIKNVRIINCDITGGANLAGLVGYFCKDSNVAGIADCYVSGSITSTFTSPMAYTAGLVGWLYANGGGFGSEVIRCGTNVTITMPSNSTTYAIIGGLVGREESGWRIKQCYSMGNFVNTGASLCVAGLVASSNGDIYDSYSRIHSTGSAFIGAFIGGFTGTIVSSYATGDVTEGSPSNPAYFGGFSGGEDRSAPDSYYCGTLHGGISDNSVGIRKTVPEMQTQSTFAGWDFATIWDIDPLINDGFPYLRDNMPE
jgi:hypothetical protein